MISILDFHIYYIFILYIIIINVIAFIAFGLDKLFAIKHMWRISEAALITLCALGGSVGGIAGMQIFRHKTKHPKFKFGVPAILIIELILLIILLTDFLSRLLSLFH